MTSLLICYFIGVSNYIELNYSINNGDQEIDYVCYRSMFGCRMDTLCYYNMNVAINNKVEKNECFY